MEYKANQFCIQYGWQYYVILLQFEPLISFYHKNVITIKRANQYMHRALT